MFVYTPTNTHIYTLSVILVIEGIILWNNNGKKCKWYHQWVMNPVWSNSQGLPLRHSTGCQNTAKFTCAWVLSHFSLVQLFATPWTVAHQAPLSMGFSRQEYWNGLPCPSPEDLPEPGIESASPASPALQADSLITEPPGRTHAWSGVKQNNVRLKRNVLS